MTWTSSRSSNGQSKALNPCFQIKQSVGLRYADAHNFNIMFILRTPPHGLFISRGFKTSLIAGNIKFGSLTHYVYSVLVRSQLPTQNGDTLGAKGNSGDVVIKVENTVNRRSEVSQYDEIWVHRLEKARHPYWKKFLNDLLIRWVENKVG